MYLPVKARQQVLPNLLQLLILLLKLQPKHLLHRLAPPLFLPQTPPICHNLDRHH